MIAHNDSIEYSMGTTLVGLIDVRVRRAGVNCVLACAVCSEHRVNTEAESDRQKSFGSCMEQVWNSETEIRLAPTEG